jgi:hypothetical protein
VRIMSAGIKWFVEIIQERSQESRIEPCGSLREAREIADRAEAKVDFDPATDSIAIYRGESWATAKLFE